MRSTHTVRHVWWQGDTHSGGGCSQGNRRPKLARYRRPSLVMSSQCERLSAVVCVCVCVCGCECAASVVRTHSRVAMRSVGV
jgi:hypothetical protein